jgi:hypothetical protein
MVRPIVNHRFEHCRTGVLSVVGLNRTRTEPPSDTQMKERRGQRCKGLLLHVRMSRASSQMHTGIDRIGSPWERKAMIWQFHNISVSSQRTTYNQCVRPMYRQTLSSTDAVHPISRLLNGRAGSSRRGDGLALILAYWGSRQCND